MPLNRDCLNRSYGPETFTVAPEQIEKYTAAILEPAGGNGALPVPAAFAFVPCWPVILSALADPELGNEPGQIIHGEQRMHFERPLRVGDELSTVGTVTTMEPKGRNELYVLQLDTTDVRTGELVVRQENICISLGTAAEDPSAAPKRAPKPPPAEPPEPTRTKVVDLPEDLTQVYAEASGDRSEVHLDADVATSLGFPGIIVHGMCLLAIATQGALDDGDGPAVERISVRFANPIQPGERLEVRYWDSGPDCDFEAVAGDGRRVLTNGKVVLSR
jgi:acyl dehydratase